MTLREAQRNFVKDGAMEVRFLACVRGARIEEVPSPVILEGLDPECRQSRERAIKIVLLGTLRSMLSGRIGAIEGSLAITAIASPLHTEGPLADRLRPFAGIASELDDVPFGAAREQWAATALAGVDARTAEYELLVRLEVREACRELEEALADELLR